MGMNILTEYFFSVKEERKTRGHGITLAKIEATSVDLILENSHFHKEQ